ncbi:MAG TPA: hypothetical protein VFO10_17855 [Oligoflexus sp.]|uniref:hypothetical protein n=1 Tax=Oligoflexus sp. TaxID=1971216 RepID=UPI002D7E344A|nr:hypothetical protein [Oligoflexus sp.]HET9239129.1 hypothetical protein [Oligoflexus sp.]
MKSVLFAISLALTTQAMAADESYPYTLESVPYRDIDQRLVIGSDATGTPAPLQGLWWMDGNPQADEVMSFANAAFKDIEFDGQVVGHEATLVVYDEGIWAWHDSDEGERQARKAYKWRLVYHLVFNADYTHGKIEPILDPPEGFRFGIRIPRNPLANFTMDQVNQDEYVRDTRLLGKSNQYRFRRIVDGQGNRLPTYDSFVKTVESDGVPNALLPLCTLENTSQVLPTVCATR